LNGEEICISYSGDKGYSRLEDMLRITLHYGFECDCNRCKRESMREMVRARMRKESK
jgi:hypothetical protein